MKNITKRDIKKYILELKTIKSVLEEQFIRNEELIKWHEKQISKFERKLEEII